MIELLSGQTWKQCQNFQPVPACLRIIGVFPQQMVCGAQHGFVLQPTHCKPGLSRAPSNRTSVRANDMGTPIYFLRDICPERVSYENVAESLFMKGFTAELPARALRNRRRRKLSSVQERKQHPEQQQGDERTQIFHFNLQRTPQNRQKHHIYEQEEQRADQERRTPFMDECHNGHHRNEKQNLVIRPQIRGHEHRQRNDQAEGFVIPADSPGINQENKRAHNQQEKKTESQIEPFTFMPVRRENSPQIVGAYP